MGFHDLSRHHCKMHKLIHSLNSSADVSCLQYFRHDIWDDTACDKIISQKWKKNETDNKAFLHSIVSQYKIITCSIFAHKFLVKICFIKQKCPVRVYDQAKLLPVKTSNLLDNCPMTGCYLQACIFVMFKIFVKLFIH